MRELVESYYDYQQWANQRVLETAQRVSFDLLTNSQIDGFLPVRDTLTHIMTSQQLWLERWQGIEPAPELQPEDFPTIDSIAQRWELVDQNTDAFRRPLTDEQLATEISYQGKQGGTFTYPLWQAMLHQANHSTYHRGEVAAVLTHLGASPGELDFFRMFDGRR
jgi:uncharacterized damage-inducible protein DinB